VRLLADECCERAIVEALRAGGHDVACAAEQQPGAPDEYWLSRARQEGRVVVTQDADFGDLVCRWRLGAPGVILLRYRPEDRGEVLARLVALVAGEAPGALGRLTTVTATHVRRRPLGPA